jgi:hypothetical protein
VEGAVLRTLTDAVLKSSEIEGEKLDTEQVRSSVPRRLGMDIGGVKPADRTVEGAYSDIGIGATRSVRTWRCVARRRERFRSWPDTATSA